MNIVQPAALGQSLQNSPEDEAEADAYSTSMQIEAIETAAATVRRSGGQRPSRKRNMNASIEAKSIPNKAAPTDSSKYSGVRYQIEVEQDGLSTEKPYVVLLG